MILHLWFFKWLWSYFSAFHGFHQSIFVCSLWNPYFPTMDTWRTWSPQWRHPWELCSSSEQPRRTWRPAWIWQSPGRLLEHRTQPLLTQKNKKKTMLREGFCAVHILGQRDSFHKTEKNILTHLWLPFLILMLLSRPCLKTLQQCGYAGCMDSLLYNTIWIKET